MSGRVNSGWRRAIARLVIYSLTLQAVIAAFMLPMPLAAQSASPGSFVLCSPSGVKQIAFDQDGNPVNDQSPDAPGQCPVCLALAGASAAVLPVVDAAPSAPMPCPEFLQSGDDLRLPGAALRSLNNRGPPLPV
jgi:hypothetical protein